MIGSVSYTHLDVYKRQPSRLYKVVTAVRFSSEAVVSIHRQTDIGTPTAIRPIRTGTMLHEQLSLIHISDAGKTAQ